MVEKGGSLTLEDNISLAEPLLPCQHAALKMRNIQTLPTQEETEELPVNQNQQTVLRDLQAVSHQTAAQPATQLPNLVLTDRAKQVLQYL